MIVKAKVICEVCGLDKEYENNDDAMVAGFAHKKGFHNIK